MKLFNRLRRYLVECVFALQVGVSVWDSLKLAFWTLVFHAKLGGRRSVEVAVRIGNLSPCLRLRVGGGDLFIFYEVLMDQVYCFSSPHPSKEAKFILDLGANIGLSTLLLAAQFPKARIVCVEPHPETVELLKHNIACISDRVTLIEAAVSNTRGLLRLHFAADHCCASLLNESGQGVAVRTMTVEDVMAEAGIPHVDVLKMDIEGAERLILPLQPAWLQSVSMLAIELHYGYSFADLSRDLASTELKMTPIGVAQAMALKS